MSTRLGILISGRGSNMAAIQKAIEENIIEDAQIAIVISNKQDAPGLALAHSQNLKTAVCVDDEAILETLKAHQIEWVLLAGYNRIIRPVLLAAYPNRILNIHPSLLPAYGGKNMVGLKVHEAVLNNQETQSGCTVHLVTEEVDGGPILGQRTVPVLPDDTPERLAARVLAQEHELYPIVVHQLLQKHPTGVKSS